MTRGLADRRLHSRQSAGQDRIISARVRPGHLATVIDVSEGGVLIETSRGLPPGAMVDLQLGTSQGMHALRGRVLRCSVAALQAHAVSYRAAIRFEYRLPTRERPPLSGSGVTPSQETMCDAEFQP